MRGVMSIEELNDDSTVVDQSVLDSEIQQSDIENLSLQQQVNDEVDGIQTSDVLEQMQECSSDKEKLDVALEHILSKVGLKQKYISVEAYNEKLEKVLNISQEGFFSRVGSAINRTFTRQKTIYKKFNDSYNKLKTNGSKKDNLKDPSWSKHLICNSNDLVTGKEVVSFYKKLNDTLNSTTLDKYLQEIADITTKVAGEINKSRFVADNEASKNIIDLNNKINELTEKVTKFLLSNQNKNHDFYPDFEPIKISDVNSIKSIIEKNTQPLQNSTYLHLQQVIKDYNDNLFINANLRLAGYLAKDIRAARKIMVNINHSLYGIYNLYIKLEKSTYSLVKYIEDSSN